MWVICIMAWALPAPKICCPFRAILVAQNGRQALAMGVSPLLMVYIIALAQKGRQINCAFIATVFVICEYKITTIFFMLYNLSPIVAFANFSEKSFAVRTNSGILPISLAKLLSVTQICSCLPFARSMSISLRSERCSML